MKRNVILTLALSVIAALCLSGCVKPHDIKITSAAVESVTPTGFRSAEGVLSVGIHNPGFKFKVCNIHGTLFHQGSSVADFTADDLEVEKKSDKKYSVAGSAQLSNGVSLLSVLSMVRNLKAEEYTVDLYATVKAKGLQKNIEKKGVPLTKLMKVADKN